MFRSSPILGVGYSNFTDHNALTAHNSFVLCFAELGIVGYFFWLSLLVVAILQLNQVLQYTPGRRRWKTTASAFESALLASFAGMLVAAFFLSRSYNPILYPPGLASNTRVVQACRRKTFAAGYYPGGPGIGPGLVLWSSQMLLAIFIR